MRDLRHKAEHVEVVALSLDEVQERKMEAAPDDHDIQHLAFLFGEFEPRCYLLSSSSVCGASRSRDC